RTSPKQHKESDTPHEIPRTSRQLPVDDYHHAPLRVVRNSNNEEIVNSDFLYAFFTSSASRNMSDSIKALARFRFPLSSATHNQNTARTAGNGTMKQTSERRRAD